MSDPLDSSVFVDSEQVIPLNLKSRNDQDSRNPLLSIVSPAYNEQENLRRFCTEVSAVLDSMDISWEIVFVNDGSKDNSAELMKRLNEEDPRIKSVIFARNFGNQIAISAGLRAASGKAVIVMDADLQQPPEMIPQMVELWKQGFHVVNTVRECYGNDVSWFKKGTSTLFYKVMNNLSEIPLQPGASEFRLIDRTIINLLNQMPERTQFLRALIPWLGFKQTSIPYKVNPRMAGTPAFTTRKLIALAMDGLVSFSIKPLHWIMYLGFFVTMSIVPYGCWALFQYFVLGPKTPGWTSLVMINLLIGGTTLISLGIIGEYIGRIYTEVKRRPLFTIEQQYGIGKNISDQSKVGHFWLDSPERFPEDRASNRKRA